MFILKILLCLAVFILASLVMSKKSHAGYLDPGSGSTLVQSILSFFAFIGRMVDKVKSALGLKKS